MKFRLTKISNDFYSFSVWEGSVYDSIPLFVYAGSESKIKKHARDLGYDASIKFSVLKRDDYKLGSV
jgi:hypothetical protein